MEIIFNFETIILFGLISQGILASVLLLVKRENRWANKYLSLLIVFLSLWLCDAFFRVSGVYQQDPDFYFLPIYFSFGFGPLVYFYSRSLTDKNFRPGYPQLWHFVPVLLQFFFYVFLQASSYTYRREFWLTVHMPYTYDIELLLSFTSLLVYLWASRVEILAYKRKIENSFSNLHRIALTWLGSLHLILAVLAMIWMLEAIARLLWDYYPVTPFSSITIGITILLMAVGGILQKDLSEIANLLSASAEENASQGGEILLDPILLQRIQSRMQEEQLYLIQELSLKEFARAINAPPREVSNTINQGLEKTFIDFVNHYRVEHFKRLVAGEQWNHLSLFGLALESGFNSKSTFNRVFRKMEGRSPSEYKKESQNQQ